MGGVVESSGEDSELSDVLEIVAGQWAAIGFKIVPKPSDRQITPHVYSGDALMSMFFGIDNGVPTPPCRPRTSRRRPATSCNGRPGVSITRRRAPPASRPTSGGEAADGPH
jgi:hypothetical protein